MTSLLFPSILLFLVWFLFFFLSHTTRKEQIIMSLAGLILSPAVLLVSLGDVEGTSQTFGSVGIEDLLFAFSFFGIAAVIYQALLGRRMKPWKGKHTLFFHPVVHWFTHLIIVLAVWVILSFAFLTIFSLTSLHAFVVAGLLIGTFMIAHRHDLFLNAVASGVFITLLLFVLEKIFTARWSVDSSIPVMSSDPLAPWVWIWVVGFVIGPLYEYLRHQKLV
jgi:hypothetical protein